MEINKKEKLDFVKKIEILEKEVLNLKNKLKKAQDETVKIQKVKYEQ